MGVLLTSLFSYATVTTIPLVSPESVFISPPTSAISQSVAITSNSALSSPVNIYFLNHVPTQSMDRFNHSTTTTVPLNPQNNRPAMFGYYRWYLPKNTYMKFTVYYDDGNSAAQLQVCLMLPSAYKDFQDSGAVGNCLAGSTNYISRRNSVSYMYTTSLTGEYYYLVFHYPYPSTYISSTVTMLMSMPTYITPPSQSPSCIATRLNDPCRGNPSDYILIQSTSAVNSVTNGALDDPRLIRFEVRNEILWWIPLLIAVVTFVVLICLILVCLAVSIVVAVMMAGKSRKVLTTEPAVMIQPHAMQPQMIQPAAPQYQVYPDVNQAPATIPMYEDPNAWRMNVTNQPQPNLTNAVYTYEPQLPGDYNYIASAPSA